MRPKNCLDDLSDLAPQSPVAAATVVFSRGGPDDRKAYILSLNAIRLLDHCIREYTLGLDAMQEYRDRSTGFGIAQMTNASGHFESCMLAAERFIKHVQALRSAPFAASDLKALIPKTAKYLLNDAESRITRLRHCLAHLERDAKRGELPEGEYVALMATESGLEIGQHSIEWNELAEWLREMHACAAQLARYDPSSSGASREP